jgi:hypothetical protein
VQVAVSAGAPQRVRRRHDKHYLHTEGNFPVRFSRRKSIYRV